MDISFFVSDGRVDCIFFYCRWSKWWNCKWHLKYLLVCGEVDFSITEIGSEREKVNETPCKREIEVFMLFLLRTCWCLSQGHPTTVFCKISVRTSKYCLEFYLRTDKNFKMAVPLMNNFRSLCNKFPRIFWSLIFHISHPGLAKKESKNFRDSKMRCREESEKFSLS